MSEPKTDAKDLVLRPPLEAELPAASALCLRSKAHWGYDQTFLEACRDELTLKPENLVETEVILAIGGSTMVGVAQLSLDERKAEIDKLFIKPDWIGRGVGRVLFEWTVGRAREIGAQAMFVTADPFAEPFYEKMGFIHMGSERSGSIPGRELKTYRIEL